ncbi:uncharacterized protein CANTADRAFT_19490 [Suhomyces tanzawaensis NRRL Y-17324]|uniref:Uncharacterized protein n=1 Tax=Suhomyces tanzawaensis NRRL Y-17324 TaxID=984487 RepID=A0A1E4SQW2_9ASCO|nr:uncharacterized protein CANTADRAFT_19490 [Suhomyces tanzawaensis NRRL Y-17324]ODV81885.1 hypothetical protein CANTADRAFT_19490 [Suhomyces tanzawaensis NRRL Y-17324]
MKNPKGPKLGKRAQALLKKQEENSFSKEPSTAEEFLEQGSIDEESGDRWLGSDLSKSLRFYQRAYTSYLESIRLQTPAEPNLDSYYNSSRLLYQVYYQYFKTDGVNVYELTNVEDALGGGQSSVVQPLSNIVEAHEVSMRVAATMNIPVPMDLLFNTAVVYTEVLEAEQENDTSDYNQLLELTFNAQQILGTLLDRQVSEFHKFLQELEETSSASFESEPVSSNQQVSQEQSKQEEYTSVEVVQPTDIFETIIASYKLCQSMLENINHSDQQKLSATDLINPFLSKCDEITLNLIDKYSEANSQRNEMISNISLSQIDELKVAKTAIIGLTMNDLDQILQLWDDSGLPDTSERYMVAADNIQSLLDRFDITLAVVNSSGDAQAADTYWNALTKMGSYLKKAQTKLDQNLQEKKKIPSGVDLGLGALISQLSEVIIARADIDLQRSQIMGHESAQKNQQILLQNTKTLLKNAMNISNTPGGLRERVAEKLQREKKKVDAVIRMCVLEKKTSVQELDSILGRAKWTNELPSIQRLGYYDGFGVQGIQNVSDF